MAEDVEVVPTNIEALINAFQAIGGGDLAEETADGMKECVKSTMIHDKRSKLVITLDFEKIADDQVAITGSSKATVPTPKPKSGFFVNDMTFLPARERPKQQTIPGIR